MFRVASGEVETTEFRNPILELVLSIRDIRNKYMEKKGEVRESKQHRERGK